MRKLISFYFILIVVHSFAQNNKTLSEKEWKLVNYQGKPVYVNYSSSLITIVSAQNKELPKGNKLTTFNQKLYKNQYNENGWQLINYDGELSYINYSLPTPVVISAQNRELPEGLELVKVKSTNLVANQNFESKKGWQLTTYEGKPAYVNYSSSPIIVIFAQNNYAPEQTRSLSTSAGKENDLSSYKKLVKKENSHETSELDKKIIPSLFHKVKNGDTLLKIARKYNVRVIDILHNNPKLTSNNLYIGQELIVKSNRSNKTKNINNKQQVFNRKNKSVINEVKNNKSINNSIIRHKVKKGETLFSIARKYHVKVSEIFSRNKDLNPRNLQVGQEIIVKNDSFKQSQVVNKKTVIYKNENKTVNEVKADNIISDSNKSITRHKVKKGETLFTIARKYGLQVNQIFNENPDLNPRNFRVGKELIINYKNGFSQELLPYKVHYVKPNETLYSISKNYGLTVKKLKKLNGLTSNFIKVGQKLILR